MRYPASAGTRRHVGVAAASAASDTVITPAAQPRRVSRFPRLSRAEVAVFLGGTASMGLELLAGRLVTPTFGSSIYVWGSVIGVFLVALSAGYEVGGRVAGRATRDHLGSVLGLAAILAGVLVVGGEAVVAVSTGLPLPTRYAAVPAVLVLFGPMTFLIGLVSPWGAELADTESTGGASGRVYALGTLGSIIGTFGTTFVLIPRFEVSVIAALFGAILLVAAFAVVDLEVKTVGPLAMAALFLLSATVLGVHGAQVGEQTLYQDQTAYSDLRVGQEDGVRTLYLDGVRHSAMYTDSREGYVFEYSQYAHIPMLYDDSVEDVLFVGGGGFSGPKRFASEYDVDVDVVEIDPGVVRAAREYFGVSEGPGFDIHTMDGRRYLEQTNETYDLVVLDAYQQSAVPFHLTTVEFMELVGSRLDANGSVVANVISARSGGGSAFFRAQFKTMQRAFPHVYAFPTTDTTALQNIELVATKGDSRTEAELRALARTRNIGIDLTDAVTQYTPASDVRTSDVPLLTDSHAPVDALLQGQVGKRYVVVQNNSTSARTVADSGLSRAAP
jgi:spermidine synthase